MAPHRVARFHHPLRTPDWLKIVAEMPSRADWVVTLDAERQPYA